MKILKLFLISVLVIGMVSSACVAAEKRTAEIIELKGKAEVVLAAGDKVPAKVGMVLNEGDALMTAERSKAIVRLSGAEKATVEVDKDTQIMFSELMSDSRRGTQKTLLDVAIGKILIQVEKMKDERSKFEVRTPTSVVGVRGTSFSVEVEGLE